MRPFLALRAAGVSFDLQVVPLRQDNTTDALANVSPTGKVPVLREGSLVLWESLAICEYAAELAPDVPLWPRDRQSRALARALSCEMHAGFVHLRHDWSMDIRNHRKAALSDAARRDVQRIVEIWSERLRDVRDGRYLFGEFGIVDAMFAPVVARFRSYGAQVDAAVRGYMDAVWDHPAVVEWVERAHNEPWVIS